MGFCVKAPRFGGMRGVSHPAYPQIWTLPREVPKSQKNLATLRLGVRFMCVQFSLTYKKLLQVEYVLEQFICGNGWDF